MKLLKEKYKTLDGAQKRAAFENAMALGEYIWGRKARRYSYSVVMEVDGFRVQRTAKEKVQPWQSTTEKVQQ